MHNKFIAPIWISFISVLTQGLGEKPSSEVVCGHADKLFERCFSGSDFQNTSKVYLNQRKVPYTTEDISGYCRLFERGIQCYNEYTETCMGAMDKRLINGEVEPAKNFYSMLCKDKKFTADYMTHRDCFRHIEKDFEECTRHYQQVVGSEFTRTEREKKSNINIQYMHFCCARYSYENCVYNSALHKCSRSSAKFTRKIVELLSSERQFKNCAKIEDTLCASVQRMSVDALCLLMGLAASSFLRLP